MKYKEIKPCIELELFIHSYWELKGSEHDKQWERNFPDGCAGLVINLGDTCLTDNGSVSMEFGKTYAVGAMTSFKDSLIDSNTHLLGVCLKPATFANFYNYVAQNELTDNTVEFEKFNSFNVDKILEDPSNYLNQFFTDRIKSKNNQLQTVINDIHSSNGRLSIYELSKRNYTTVRQLERNFKTHIGISPKEYSNIIRFQNALTIIKNSSENRSLLDIAFECGFYDHSHLTNEIKRNTGLSPSQL
jgi:AraC-like DNA-binding protein